MFGGFSIKVWLIAAAVLAAVSGGIYFKGRWDGSSACDARHAAAVLEVTEKERTSDAKIKREAPDDIDKQRALEFLRDNVRN